MNQLGNIWLLSYDVLADTAISRQLDFGLRNLPTPSPASADTTPNTGEETQKTLDSRDAIPYSSFYGGISPTFNPKYRSASVQNIGNII